MNDRVHHPAGLIYSPGTQVVILREITGQQGQVLHPRGAVGVIVKSPGAGEHSYRVRFPDGVEAALGREELLLLAKYQEDALGENAHVIPRAELLDRVFFRCVIGSRAYGLEGDDSDTDYRGIYLPTATQHWSIFGVPDNLECHETQEQYWELQRFLVLALKANPTVLECLSTPLVEKRTPLAEELLAMRSVFLSRLLYQTYNGYVMSQFRKMQADLRNQGRVKWKHVMHLIRLLLTGIRALRDGVISVRVEEHRDQLLAIKREELSWQETERWRKSLHLEFDAALSATRLPERPDYARVNAFLIDARRRAQADTLP